MTIYANAGFDLSKTSSAFSVTVKRAAETTFTLTKGNLSFEDGNSTYKFCHGAAIDDVSSPYGVHPLTAAWSDKNFMLIFGSAYETEAASAGWGEDAFLYSVSGGKYTLAATSTFSMEFGNTFSRQLLGFTATTLKDASSYTANHLPWFKIDVELTAVSVVSDEYEPGNISSVAISDSGKALAISRTVPVEYFDFTVEFEPKSKVFIREATAGQPFTWQHLIDHCRTYPVVWTGTHWSTNDPCIMLREPEFDPKPWYPDDHTKWNIPFDGILLGYD